mmetsp:Transcript_5735/g.14218  ORF Transcript_5735/g.14218 Transcript_5735/m.14218 type:complete len:557 (+) Transcript_5735:259-1929(+)
MTEIDPAVSSDATSTETSPLLGQNPTNDATTYDKKYNDNDTAVNDTAVNETKKQRISAVAIASGNANDSENDSENESESESITPKSKSTATIWDDVLEVVKLAVPIFVSNVSWVGKKTTDTALLGHLGQEALAASALSDLWTSTTAVFLSGHILGIVSGSLIGGAVGAGNPKLAGIYIQVACVVVSAVGCGVVVLWNLTETVWLWFGSDPEISAMAGTYSRLLSLAIPGIIAFNLLTQFFSAQKILRPEATASAMGLVANLVLGLTLVLGWPIPGFGGFGFAFCPLVTTAVTYVQVAFVVLVCVGMQRLHEPCWPGLVPHEITRERIRTFSGLYFPAALSGSSDFWRAAVIGSVAASMGEIDVAVFNTAYRIMWIALIFVNSNAAAAAINVSLRLGNMDPHGAKQAACVGIGLAVAVVGVLGWLVLWKSRWFGKIFTNDEEFLDLFVECSVPFALTLCFMNLAVAIERIPYSMGRSKEVFWMSLVGSWFGQVPAVLILTTYWRNDLVGLYSGMAIGYFLLTILYAYIVAKRCVARLFAEWSDCGFVIPCDFLLWIV